MEPTHECAACQVIAGVGAPAVDHDPSRHAGRRFAALKRTEDHVADRVTAFAGSLGFVYIHAAWFAAWIVLNAGALGAALIFDRFPYGLLTMVVSLEAIFLSTFVMVSQNRQAARSDVRADVDFENNLRSEIWSIHIGEALGIDASHVETVVRDALDRYRAVNQPR